MKIAIFTNKPYNQCETFIKLQIDKLPFDIIQYWGQKLPFNFEVINKKSNLFIRILNKAGLLKTPQIIDQFCDKISNDKLDLVLAQYGMVGAKVLPICIKLNLPLLVHFHGHDAVRKSVLETFNNYKELFSYSKLTVISVSHEMTKRLIDIGCPKEKIIYNTYGPNDDFLNLKPNYSKKQFLSIGRFVEKKAPHLTLLALQKVIKIHPDLNMVFAGDGILLDSCKDLAEALGIEDNINFVGRITPNDYQNYLKESLAYVQHSIEAQDGDMEGTPVSILEASAAGLPIISTIHAGIPDVIKHNETGLISKEKDIKAMANNMLWILEHKDDAKQMGRKGKLRIEETFSMSHHIENLTRIIELAARP